MKRILIDTNVILDIALMRQPFFEASAKLFYLIDQNKISANITASTITDIYYIAKKERSHELAIQFITGLLDIVEVLGVDKDVVTTALESGLKDFEDAVQVTAAVFNKIEVIVTRNKTDFLESGMKIYTPDEFINSI